VYNIAEELAGERGTITAFLSGEEHVWLVFNEPAGLAAERSAQRCDEFAAQVADKAKQFLKIDLFVVFAGATSDLKRIGALHRSATEGLASSYYSEAFRIRLPVPSAAYVQPNAAEFGKEQGIALQAFRDGNPSLLDIAVGGIKTKACRESYDPLAVIGAFEDIVRQAAAEYRLPPSPAFFALMQRTARIGETVRMARRQLREMLQHAGSAAPGGREDHDLGKINRYIEEHIGEMVTSVDVANYLHLNSSYFSRLFKRRTGVNFTEYVHQYKMKLAKSLLARPDETVENVAYTLGYSDRAYFSKVFKKYMGMNPSDYKHSQNP
jgi:two-component system response regulator YesN